MLGRSKSHHLLAGRRREEEVRRREEEVRKRVHIAPLMKELQPRCQSSAGRELGQAVVRNHLLKKLGLSRPLLIPQPAGAKGVN